MAKNITINGQHYTDKAAIKAPLTDGSGYATYVDASTVDAGASDVAAGKTIVDAAGNEVTGTATFGSNLNAIEVYVADFGAADDLTVTAGMVNRYARVVVS